MLRLFLLPCQVPFCLRASSDILFREYWHSHIVPLTTSTAIPKYPPCTMIPSSHRTALAADNRQVLDFCDAEIPVDLRDTLYPGLLAKTFDPNIPISQCACFGVFSLC